MRNHEVELGPGGDEIERQRRRVQALRVSVYTRPDPAESTELQTRLVEEEATLQKMLLNASAAAPATPHAAAPAPGRLLGLQTTGLEVRSTVCMHPLPTGIYNLLDPDTEPLVKVSVRNESRGTVRVRVRAFIERLSARAVKTVEVERGAEVTVHLLPTLLPERARAILEVQRATLHVVSENLDGKLETHETHHVTCLARTSSFNVVRDPATGTDVDLSHYYGAWVTPYADAVQERIRRAADLRAERQMWGYQGPREGVKDQVEALYRSLKEAQIAYVNSVVDYGGGSRYATQRTRLPRQSIDSRSANCIDGAVLFASLLEGASLNAALLLVPGHALVGWESWDGEGKWEFLETTMIGTADFAAANKSGNEQYSAFAAAGMAQTHPLGALRLRGIWPME